MASLKLEHIYKVYPNGTKAVNDISLDIKDGEFVVFVGPSGCGKSTTLRMIAGLEDITAGELYIDNQIVNDVEPKDRDIAMVFQNYALYPHMTVYENMAFGLKLRHVPDDEIQEKVLWAADILGIKDYLDRRPKNMSGGQRQRVALGRSILRNPKVMLLDEPLSNLDAKLRTQMRTEIAKLHQKLKTTFIYVTHDQIEAMTLGDRVVVMKGGRIQQVDTPKNLYDYPSNKFVAGFIGTPQMNFFHCTLLKKADSVIVSMKENGEKLTVPFNQLVKVLPQFLDGKHDITMGIRCEHILLATSLDTSTVKVRVSHFEELGADCLIYGNVNLDSDSIASDGVGTIVIKVMAVDGIKPGDIISVSFDMDFAYFFDDKSEDTVVPRIPSYNSFTCQVEDNHLKFLQSDIILPPALSTGDIKDADLRIPTDGFLIGKEGIKATVIKTEVIGTTNLVHLSSSDRTFFMVAPSPYKPGENISLGIDFTKMTLVFDKNTILSPISEIDSFKGTFFNYQTVIAKDNDPEYVKFRDDKIASAIQFMDAQILLENQDFDKKKLEISNADKNAVGTKALEEYQTICENNLTAIKELKAKTKKELSEKKTSFLNTKKDLKAKNDSLFADKKNNEEQEFKAFKENNKDKDSLKRRTDEYHIFKDNFQTDKENTLNNLINGVTMDYESEISSLKSGTRRQVELYRKEISDKKNEYQTIVNPLKVLTKEHDRKLSLLQKQKADAVKRAGLVFFFKLPGDYYSMATDIISNKLIQGLGTRVFSKEFLIEIPHDAYTLSAKSNSFSVIVNKTLDYGDNTYFVRATYKDDNGDEQCLFIKTNEKIPDGKTLGLGFDIARSRITETDMNIRLY